MGALPFNIAAALLLSGIGGYRIVRTYWKNSAGPVSYYWWEVGLGLFLALAMTATHRAEPLYFGLGALFLGTHSIQTLRWFVAPALRSQQTKTVIVNGFVALLSITIGTASWQYAVRDPQEWWYEVARTANIILLFTTALAGVVTLLMLRYFRKNRPMAGATSG